MKSKEEKILEKIEQIKRNKGDYRKIAEEQKHKRLAWYEIL